MIRFNDWDSWLKLAEHAPAAARLIERYQHRPAEELYDLQTDPYEQRNLATDPAHASELNDLRERLKAWRMQQGDPLDKVTMPDDARYGPLRYAG